LWSSDDEYVLAVIWLRRVALSAAPTLRQWGTIVAMALVFMLMLMLLAMMLLVMLVMSLE
jgi:hypothetical protein